MSLRRLSLFALSLAALPMAAQAQDQGITGARILACEADRTGENCATLLSQLYVCKEAEEMAGCAELLALRDAAVDLSEREGALNGDEQDGEDDDGAGNEAPEGEAGAEDGIVTQPEGAEHIEVEVRAEGELADELEEESFTEGEERLREEDEAENGDANDATGRPDDDTSDEGGAAEDAAGQGAENGAAMDNETACAVLNSADWAAWVNAMPGPDGPSLIVTGVVTLPSPGYTVTLEAGASDRSARPVQVVQLMAEPPELAAAQVLSDYDVRFEMASPAPVDGTVAPFTAVRVVCGEQEITRIEPVEVAQ